jgi:hypothetical protein
MISRHRRAVDVAGQLDTGIPHRACAANALRLSKSIIRPLSDRNVPYSFSEVKVVASSDEAWVNFAYS